MKNKLLILSLFVYFNSFGQSVPNTESFSLWNIYDAIMGSHPAFSNLNQAFINANPALFDSRYYPYYLVSGTKYLAHNSQLNFRNYMGTPDGIPIPVATAATNISGTSFQANWNASVGANGYYLDVSEASDFSSFVEGYENYDNGDFEGITVSGLYYGTDYYYRVRAYTPNGTSGYSNTISVTTAEWDNPNNYHDWIMPTTEDMALIDNNIPWWIDPELLGKFWSGETYIPDSDQAWFYTFTVGSGHMLKINSAKVLAVRVFDSTDFYNVGDIGPAGGFIYSRVPIFPLGTYTYKETTPTDVGFGNWVDAFNIVANL